VIADTRDAGKELTATELSRYPERIRPVLAAIEREIQQVEQPFESRQEFDHLLATPLLATLAWRIYETSEDLHAGTWRITCTVKF